jgi:hypothetical protein
MNQYREEAANPSQGSRSGRRGMMRSSSTGTALRNEYVPSATSRYVASSPTSRRRMDVDSNTNAKGEESLGREPMDDIGVSGGMLFLI